MIIMKKEKIVLGNEMETPSWSLRKEILNFDKALTAYDHMSTDADIPHVYFSLCLASWVSNINKIIREYITDLDKGECHEVLGIDFHTMTKKEYWLKSGKLRSYLLAMNGKPLSDYLSSRLFEAKAGTTTDDIFRSIDEGVSEMVELLKEVKRKTMEASPEFYENFYQRMKAQQDQEVATAAYEEWKMGAGRLTFELLKDKQVLTVAEFLKRKILRFTLIPSKWEIDEVCLDKVKRHLPYDYELPEEFEKCCARIRRYISWDGDILRIRYPKYGHYLFQHYYSMTDDERQTLFDLDTTLQLIHRDMAEIKPNETTLLPEVLATPEAMLLWQKVQQAGYVDEHYQPKLSRTQAALLADEMAKRLGIREKWKVFETLWNRRNMYRDYQDALNQRQTLQFSDNLKNLFK